MPRTATVAAIVALVATALRPRGPRRARLQTRRRIYAPPGSDWVSGDEPDVDRRAETLPLH